MSLRMLSKSSIRVFKNSFNSSSCSARGMSTLIIEKEKGDESRYFKQKDEELKAEMRAKLEHILESGEASHKQSVINLLAPKEEKKGFLASVGLDDWKFALPIALVTAQAAVANEVIILDVQFQMGCIFMFTVATLYSGAGGAIGKSLDDYSQGIKDHVSQVDQETLAELAESIKANEKLIQLEQDVSSLQSLSDDLAVAQADVLNSQNQLKYRDAISKKLDSLVAIEEAAVAALRTRMLAKVKADVLSSFKTDKKVKENALTQAISVLSAGSKATFGKDIVGNEYASALKKYNAEYAKQAKGSDPILVQLEKDLAAVALPPSMEQDTAVYADTFLLGNQIKV